MTTKDWWSSRVATLRLGPKDPGYSVARAELCEALTAAAERMPDFCGWRRSLGDAVVDDAARDVVMGCATKRAPAYLSLKDTTATMRLELEGWRAGVLDRLERGLVEEPLAYFRTALHHRLVEVDRARRRIVNPLPPHGEDQEGEDGTDWRREGVSSFAFESDPYEVPHGVGRTLRDAAALLSLALDLAQKMDERHPLHPLINDQRNSKRRIALWDQLSQFVRDDVSRRSARRRWARGVEPAHDNQNRAWQARYYQHEGLDDHWDASERPEDDQCPTDAALVAQHLRRFRTTFAEATQVTRTIVAQGEASPLQGAVRAGRRAVPAEWDAPEHITLQSGRDR